MEISTKAFGADMTPYWHDRRKGRFFEKVSKFCLLVDPLGNISGWTGYHRRIFGNAHCLYLDSSGVLPESQGGGLMGHVHARMIASECLTYAPDRCIWWPVRKVPWCTACCATDAAPRTSGPPRAPASTGGSR
ncbi:hypothetical protein GCM10020295_77270 [Streptomyces cinereospinus]